MRAITVRQPWAWAIICGGKDVENRTGLGAWWRVAGERVLIHAGKGWSDRGQQSRLIREAADKHSWRHHYALCHEVAWRGRPMDPFVGGAIIGAVTVLDVHAQADDCCESPWAETKYYDADRRLRTGLVHLVLDDPRPIRPIDCRGALGPWRVPDEIAAELREAARR